MSFEIKPATRVGIKPLVGLYSESGCGKTMSSLLLARGMAGPTGKIVMIDTESGRGQLYADVIPGGYDVLSLGEPFTPARYIEAIRAAEESKPAVLVIDSASHEWSGLGGVTDMATEQEGRGMKGLGVWKVPKMEHAKFMLKLLQSPLPIITCLRAKHKSRQAKNTQGRTEIIKDDFTTPIQADDFIFEATFHAEILQDHSLRVTKCSHPALKGCFPAEGPVTVEHGRLLAAWCAAPSTTAPAAKPSTVPPDDRKAVMQALWKTCLPIRGSDQSWKTVVAKLIEWKIVPADKKLADLSVDQLREVLEKTQIAIDEMEPATP